MKNKAITLFGIVCVVLFVLMALAPTISAKPINTYGARHDCDNGGSITSWFPTERERDADITKMNGIPTSHWNFYAVSRSGGDN